MKKEKQNIVPQFDIEPPKNNRIRVRVLQIGILILFALVGLRLIQIQIIESQKYRCIALKQYQSIVILPAARGLLYDRKGNVIASNSTLISFAADPKVAAEDAEFIAQKFSRYFGKPKRHYLEELRSDSRFVWLERLVDIRYLREINSKKLNGVVVRYEPKRLYYNDHLAGQAIGWTNIDHVGVTGLEQQYEKQLHGTDGYVVFQRDGKGKARPSVDYPRVEPQNGNNIYLTIDLQFQAIVEKELKRGVEQNNAESGLAIILDPRTCEILALGQYPNVDPNNYGKARIEDQRLRAFTDLFEPGSIFKIVTASAGLDGGIVKPETRYFAENGVYTVYSNGKKIRPITDTHKEGWLTFRQAMEKSSNIVMAKLSDHIGAERFYKMARDFGFGTATNIDFPGEVTGVLKKPIEWSATTLNRMAFGYEVGVTPLQIACAYAAIANDGILMKPYLFSKETDPDGTTLQESKPQQIRRVVSQTTAQTMKQLFEDVVQYGTAASAKINAVRIGGKTGTSKKIIGGSYESSGYIASFVGFFPVEDPKVVCLVMIDNPRSGAYYGGTVSAPVFRAIAEQIITTTEVMSRTSPAMASTVTHAPSEDAEKERHYFSSGLIPDVKGYSIRRAIEILRARKLQPVVNGYGVVTYQNPEAGKPAKNGMKITLTCEPKVSASLGLN